MKFSHLTSIIYLIPYSFITFCHATTPNFLCKQIRFGVGQEEGEIILFCSTQFSVAQLSELFYSRDSSSCFYGSKNNAMKGNTQSVLFAYLKMYFFFFSTLKRTMHLMSTTQKTAIYYISASVMLFYLAHTSNLKINVTIPFT